MNKLAAAYQPLPSIRIRKLPCCDKQRYSGVGTYNTLLSSSRFRSSAESLMRRGSIRSRRSSASAFGAPTSVANHSISDSSSRPPNSNAFDDNEGLDDEAPFVDMTASSLFLFSPTNPFRLFCHGIATHFVFNQLTLAAILLNSVTLAMDQPAIEEPAEMQTFLFYAEYVFVIFFGMEVLIRVVSLGFFMHKGSYLRSAWNWLDITTVVASMVSLWMDNGVNLSAMRVLRVLRPLRTVNRIAALRMIVTGLLGALPMVMDNILLLMFLLVVFGILGINLWAGALHRRCYFETRPPAVLLAPSFGEFNASTQQLVSYPHLLLDDNLRCGGVHTCVDFASCSVHLDKFQQAHLNFDNMLSSVILVFKIISMDNWTDDVRDAVHASGFGAVAFYLLLYLFGSSFCVNMFIAILAEGFSRSSANDHAEQKRLKELEEFHQPGAENVAGAILLQNLGLTEQAERLLQQRRSVANDDHGCEAAPAAGVGKVDDSSAGSKAEKGPKLGASASSAFDDIPLVNEEDGDGVQWQLADSSAKSDTKTDDKSKTSSNKDGSLPSTPGKTTNRPEPLLLDVGAPKSPIGGALSPRLNVPDGSKLFVDSRRSSHLSSDDGHTNRSLRTPLSPSAAMFDEATPDASDLTPVQLDTTWLRLRRGSFESLALSDSEATADVERDSDDESLDSEAMEALITAIHVSEEVERKFSAPRLLLRRIVLHPSVGYFMLLVTVANVVILAMDRHDISKQQEDNLGMASDVCTGIFLAEIVGKIAAMGFVECFSDNFNVFDALLVAVSLPEFFLDSGTSALNAFRAFRMLRVMRLARRLETLQMLLGMVMSSLKPVGYLSLLITLFVYTFSVMGMNLFGADIDAPNTRLAAFGTVYDAAITCFVVMTGDHWATGMEAAMAQNYWSAAAFYLLLFVIGKFVLINLFVAIILENLASKLTDTKTTSKDDIRLLTFLPFLPNTKKVKKQYQQLNHTKELKAIVQMAWGRMVAVMEDRNIPNLEGNSLGIFSPTNTFRKFVVELVSTSTYDVVNDIIIFVNVVFLAVEHPEMSVELTDLIFYGDYFFGCAFAMDLLLRCIAYGAWTPRGDLLNGIFREDDDVGIKPAVFRDIWNILDCLVASTAILGLFIEELRIIRALRALRLLLRNTASRLVLHTLVESIPHVANGAMLCAFLFLIFAILGVQLFKGRYYACNDESVFHKANCVGEYDVMLLEAASYTIVKAPRQWVRKKSNFDDILQATFTLVKVAIGEDWHFVLFDGIDSTGTTTGPRRGNAPWVALFFVGFFVCSNFFALNMIMGILINYFTELKKANDGSILLTEKQRAYFQARKTIDHIMFRKEIERPEHPVRQICYDLVRYGAEHNREELNKIENDDERAEMEVGSTHFERVVTVLVILNMAALSTTHYGMSQEHEWALEIINYCFTGLFVIEIILKTLGLGFDGYFSDGWNTFDFVVTGLSIIGIGAGIGGGATVARVFRVGRLFRLLKTAKGLKRLFSTMLHALPSFINVFVIVIATIFVFAVTGVTLFGKVKHNGALNQVNNFETVPNAMFLLYQLSSTDMWEDIMNACTIEPPDCEPELGNCGIPSAPAFFILYIFSSTFVILQLFVAVIVETFTDQETFDIPRIARAFYTLKTEWTKTYGAEVTSIPAWDLLTFIPQLPFPLTGLPRNCRPFQVTALMRRLELPLNAELNVEYRDLVYCFARKVFEIDDQVLSLMVFSSDFHGNKSPFTAAEQLASYSLQLAYQEYLENKRKRRLFDVDRSDQLAFDFPILHVESEDYKIDVSAEGASAPVDIDELVKSCGSIDDKDTAGGIQIEVPSVDVSAFPSALVTPKRVAAGNKFGSGVNFQIPDKLPDQEAAANTGLGNAASNPFLLQAAQIESASTPSERLLKRMASYRKKPVGESAGSLSTDSAATPLQTSSTLAPWMQLAAGAASTSGNVLQNVQAAGDLEYEALLARKRLLQQMQVEYVELMKRLLLEIHAAKTVDRFSVSENRVRFFVGLGGVEREERSGRLELNIARRFELAAMERRMDYMRRRLVVERRRAAEHGAPAVSITGAPADGDGAVRGIVIM